MGHSGMIAALSAVLASGCATAAPDPVSVTLEETRFLAENIVQVVVAVEGVPDPAVIRTATDCAAAEAAMLQRLDFARHVRTAMREEGGIRRADAVYSVTKDVPRGDFILDVAVQAEACRELEEAGVIANYG
ncbi:hypothetical protein [Ovoidimarina sediminis]|uniref:hypothetical protein n=1 Tax=Ovoidimarina sediminis TaxID=3079856 RepID=UPI0029124B1B|nr:hypothetical protein [Rhodophyticola sp. MJ-SS7]MDU8945883.1 hypothetical protein [Rhodophyticola sp. MJ-SS7]